jgi:cytochrome c553
VDAVTRIDADAVWLRVLARVRTCALASICAIGTAAHAGRQRCRGKGRFGLCESCHGVQAQGNVGLGAPAIAGLPAWYVTRQLENFRAARRGVAREDARGQQMRSMAQTLESPEAVADVVAYLATLKPAARAETIHATRLMARRSMRPASHVTAISGRATRPCRRRRCATATTGTCCVSSKISRPAAAARRRRYVRRADARDGIDVERRHGAACVVAYIATLKAP